MSIVLIKNGVDRGMISQSGFGKKDLPRNQKLYPQSQLQNYV